MNLTSFTESSLNYMASQEKYGVARVIIAKTSLKTAMAMKCL
jgi:hypothetical protein